MQPQKFALAQALMLGLLGLSSAVGCKDRDPCDPEHTEKNGQCYPAAPSAAGGGASSGGAAQGGAPDATAGATGAPLDTPVGTPCADTTASSDCGGDAPVCADLSPLGQSVMCTQIDCAKGEANEGACPSGFTCFAVPGYPSVCISE